MHLAVPVGGFRALCVGGPPGGSRKEFFFSAPWFGPGIVSGYCKTDIVYTKLERLLSSEARVH